MNNEQSQRPILKNQFSVEAESYIEQVRFLVCFSIEKISNFEINQKIKPMFEKVLKIIEKIVLIVKF